jgi:hypothetical protein
MCADGTCVEVDAGTEPPPPPPPCEDLADLTVVLDSVCPVDGGLAIGARACNRGTRDAADVVVAFFQGAEDAGAALCVTRAVGEVAVGACVPVSCSVEGAARAETITARVNPPGSDGGQVQECNFENNENGLKSGKACIDP